MAGSAETTGRTTRRWLAALAAAVAVLAPGCKSGTSNLKQQGRALRSLFLDSAYEDPEAQAKFAAARAQFDEGSYSKALKGFRELADNRSNPAGLLEDARFMQAECRYAAGEYPEAVDTYHKLLLDFPTGAHRREACGRMFEICDYWLDDFRDELKKRSDETGVMKWRPEWKNPFDKTRPWLGQEGRTLEALDHIWTHDMTGPTADRALFWCGYVNFVRGNFQEADHFFSTLAEMHKESPLRPQAMAYAIQAKNNATGGAEYDGRKCAEALQLVHTAEATIPELTKSPEMAEKLTRAKFAIRYQQAEKDFRMAEYYERTGHPGSAVFYYELVRRRYAGTRYSELAGEKKEHLVALMKEGKPAPGRDPFAVVQAKWKEVFGAPQPAKTGDEPPAELPKVQPAGGPPPLPAGAVQAGP